MIHGNRKTYSAGCRCSDCTEAHRLYLREYRQRRRERVGAAMAVAPQVTPTGNELPVSRDQQGSVVAAVESELELLGAHERRPGLAQAALTLGRLLDTPEAYTHHASAVRALQRALDELGKGRGVPRGRLKAVTAMMARSPDAG